LLKCKGIKYNGFTEWHCNQTWSTCDLQTFVSDITAVRSAQ